MKIKLKRINKKRPWEKSNLKVMYLKLIPAETTPIIGNFDAIAPIKHVTVSKKWFMTFQQGMKIFKGKRYYESKIRRSKVKLN